MQSIKIPPRKLQNKIVTIPAGISSFLVFAVSIFDKANLPVISTKVAAMTHAAIAKVIKSHSLSMETMTIVIAVMAEIAVSTIDIVTNTLLAVFISSFPFFPFWKRLTES
jgi:hypothetical protein